MICCAQLDLIVQEVLYSMYNENFLNTIQLLTGHLRRQKTLVREMKSTCPRFITTRWLSMGKLLNWLKSKHLFVQDHLNHKSPSCKPKEDCWIIAYVLQKVMELCNKYMIELQGKQLLVAQ